MAPALPLVSMRWLNPSIMRPSTLCPEPQLGNFFDHTDLGGIAVKSIEPLLLFSAQAVAERVPIQIKQLRRNREPFRLRFRKVPQMRAAVCLRCDKYIIQHV